MVFSSSVVEGEGGLLQGDLLTTCPHDTFVSVQCIFPSQCLLLRQAYRAFQMITRPLSHHCPRNSREYSHSLPVTCYTYR